jgi:hypothetical protein
MKMWQGGILGAVAAALLSAAPVQAAPSLGLLDTFNGPVEIKFTNWESFTNGLTIGSENYGILSIETINDPLTNTALWQKGQGGVFLTGIFYGITVSSVSDDGLSAQATGGTIKIYFNTSNLTPGLGTAGYTSGACAGSTDYSCYDGITGGELALELELASGIVADPDVTLAATFTDDEFPPTGKASAYYNVVGGALASKFDTDTIDTPFGTRDLFAQNDFCPNGVPSCGVQVGDWQMLSNDPIRGYVIPEPGTLAVLGIGLLGLGVAVRRRRRA